MKGDAGAAADALMTASSERPELLQTMTRIADSLAGAFKGKAPRLERTLPDIDVDGLPTSLQIWSFGDQEVYFVGCLVQRESKKLGIQVRLSVDLVVKELKAQLQRR